MREVGDRAGEAVTLNNMAVVYQCDGAAQRALELYEQALPLTREVGDRAGEAATLNNMALVYRARGSPSEHWSCMSRLCRSRERWETVPGKQPPSTTWRGVPGDGAAQRALELYEQALPLMREVGDRAGEATTLANIADVLYQYLNRSQEAITTMEQAIAVLVETGLPQDAAGQTRDDMQHYLDAMRQGLSLDQAMDGSAHDAFCSASSDCLPTR